MQTIIRIPLQYSIASFKFDARRPALQHKSSISSRPFPPSFDLYVCFREHVCGKRCAGRPVDQRSGHSGVRRGHSVGLAGLTAGMPVPVVPVDPVLPGHSADYGRGRRRKLRPTLPDARMLRQTDRHQDHHAPVRHMDRQLDPGHVAVHLQDGTRLLRKKGTRSTFLIILITFNIFYEYQYNL